LFKQAGRYERRLKKKIADRMKNHYIKELTGAYVETQLADKIKISEEVIAEYYNAHVEDFAIPERVRLFEIVVSSQRAAEDILRRLSTGESFELLATRESLTESKERGGDLGWIDVRKLETEIAALVTRIAPGDILANPIRSDVGYHIIKLAGKTQRRMLTLQEATPMIENILVFQEKKKEVDALIEKLREKGNVKIFPAGIDRLKEAK
jgi:parvulin-like peptidyl-prolyl isomerase